MLSQDYQHEVVVPSRGLPFKLFLFEGSSGKYIREKHWHQSVEILSVQQGSLDFYLNDRLCRLCAGDFVIANSNEVHSIHAANPNRTIVIQIPLSLLAGYFTDQQYIWFSHSKNQYDSQAAGLIEMMFAVYMEKETGYELQVLGFFYRLLYLLVTGYREPEVEEERLRSTRQLNRLGVITAYMKEHYKEEISLEGLAEQFGYSPSYLSRMFWKYAKIHYKDYLQSVRLEYAVKDLTATEKSIGDIALEHGFAGSRAFSGLFRKRYGMLPNEYRKRQKSDIGKTING